MLYNQLFLSYAVFQMPLFSPQTHLILPQNIFFLLTYVLQNENILSGTTVLAESDSNQTPAMIQAKHFLFFF